jgi:hypothetical protein
MKVVFSKVTEMKPTKPVKKPRTSAPGVKVFTTAASVAATLGGWALISSNEPKPEPAQAPTLAPAIDQAAVAEVTIKLAPLPTLVPEVTLQSQVVPVNRPRTAAVAPAVAAVPPQPAAPTTLVLRDVSAPQRNAGRSGAPAPVVNTRSSR